MDTVTTVVALKTDDSINDLVKMVHSKGSKVYLSVRFPAENLEDADFKSSLISKSVGSVLDAQADGLFMQFDGEMEKGSTDQKILSLFVRDLRNKLHITVLGAKLIVDAPWSPECIDGRCYDFLHYANNTDFMYVTAYNMRSQIFSSQCSSGPSSNVQLLRRGLREYENAGVPSSRIIVGLSWFGHDYTCKPWDLQTMTCFIPQVEFRGAKCSDRPAAEKSFAEIMALRQKAVNGSRLDSVSDSNWFTYDVNGTFHQVWYDDQHSLPAKVQLGRSSGGVGIWKLEDLFVGDGVSKKKENKMWAVMKA